MRHPRLALLNASHNPEDTTRNFRRELDADLEEFHVTDGELPEHREFGDSGSGTTGDSDERREFDGVVVTGSRSSVYGDEEWIDPLVDYVADAHDAGLPVLGVCFGHQVLAAALGGTVEAMGEYEIGYREVTQTDQSSLLDGVPESFTVFTTHSDAVTEIPAGAELLAENDYGVHAFRAGQSYGVQFHPEYDNQTAERLVHEKDLDEDRRKAVLDGVTPENYQRACRAKALFQNFTSGLDVRAAAD